MHKTALTVRQLNLYVRSLIEGDSRLSNISVTGEISNLKNHYSSGHIYFTLKDNDAAVRCVMFRSFASRIKFSLEDGLKVTLTGRVSLYEKDGQYQFYAEDISATGYGDISLAFEQIKEKLKKQGLFDNETKRSLPTFPKRIAVITSATGAAVQDIINILSRRWPVAQIVLCPVTVQGDSAAEEMISVLERLYKLSGIDVAIIGRGGGSVEDLWAFNSEKLAIKIYEAPFPIISAVGHETDFTICDFVADLRAPTPSAAAELATPDIKEICARLDKYSEYLKASLSGRYRLDKARFETQASSFCFKNPLELFVNRNYELLDKLQDKLYASVFDKIKQSEAVISSIASGLDALSPLKTLSRGYAAVKKGATVVTSATQLQPDDQITLKFNDGTVDCKVQKLNQE